MALFIAVRTYDLLLTSAPGGVCACLSVIAVRNGANVREMELSPQIVSQGTQRGPMPLQGFGVAPAGTHLLQIGCDALLNWEQGVMTGLALPGAVARRP